MALASAALGTSHPRHNPGGEVCTRNFASLERRFAPATSSHLTQRRRKPGSPEHDCALTAAPCAMAFPPLPNQFNFVLPFNFHLAVTEIEIEIVTGSRPPTLIRTLCPPLLPP